VRFRRNVGRLTAGQLRNLRSAFEAMYGLADDRGYAHHAGIHGLPLPIGCDNAHGTPYFLPWHRAYLYFFERALCDRVERAMLAWWDWRTGPQRPAHVPQAFRARTVDAQGNPLRSAHHTMVDRVWRLWQLRHRGARPPRAILDEALPPFRMTVRQTLDVTALGYDYAVGSASAQVEARR
jgi:Common central domain of tyrosinase